MQDAVVAFLSDPANHDGQVPERKETHGALIFLLPEHVYKLKRDVRYAFMDFSTPEKRRTVCEEEVHLNGRTSQGLYLGTRPIILRGDALKWGEIGSHPAETVETVVVTKRFESTLAEIPPSRDELVALAETVAAFHRSAPRLENAEGAAAVARVQKGNLDVIASEPTCDPDRVAVLREKTGEALARCAEALDRRAAAGAVRHCHGDLHLGNVCRWRGVPTLFDCIDFNPDFARIDILYDLAFLLMDLEHRASSVESNLVLNRYMECMPGEEAGLSLMPLFLSMRAQVSAKVKFAAAQYEASDLAAARRQLAFQFVERAIAYLSPPPPVLIAIGGPSGSGKSTLARALAPMVGAAPGALVSRSDVVRKRLFGAKQNTDPLPKAAYTKDAHRETYCEVETICARTLQQGHTAIADATFMNPDSRTRIEAVARSCGVPFVGIWMNLDQTQSANRVRDRLGDVSDATPDVVRQQFKEDWGTIGWHRVDASLPPDSQRNDADVIVRSTVTEFYAG